MPTQVPVGLKFRRPNEPLGLVGKLGQLWNPRELIFDIKALRELAYREKFKGPFIVVMSTTWNSYLDQPWNPSQFFLHPNAAKRVGDIINALPGVKELRTSDQLPEWECVLYQE